MDIAAVIALSVLTILCLFMVVTITPVKYNGQLKHQCFHKWEKVRDTRIHRYYQCTKCNGRRIIRSGTRLAQPVDMQWLETGKWRTSNPPPPRRPVPPKHEVNLRAGPRLKQPHVGAGPKPEMTTQKTTR